MDGRVEGEDKDGQELSRGGAKGGGRLSKIALYTPCLFSISGPFLLGPRGLVFYVGRVKIRGTRLGWSLAVGKGA